LRLRKKGTGPHGHGLPEWALADFSGSVGADDLDNELLCILSVVDNRCYKRIYYDVLDDDPDYNDIRVFLGRLKTGLEARNLTLLGLTTYGSILYPEPLAEFFRECHIKAVRFML
jgi:hypothetical protein